MVSGAGMLLVGAALLGESPAAIVWNATSIASLSYLTLLSGVVAFLIYFALLDEVGPSQLHLVGYAEPVVAAVGSWALLGSLSRRRQSSASSRSSPASSSSNATR